MKTLSIAAILLFAFGTVTFAQDATSTIKTSTTKTTPTNVKKHYHNCPKAINKNLHPGTVTGTAK